MKKRKTLLLNITGKEFSCFMETTCRLDFQPLWESGYLSSSQLVWGKERGLTKRLEIEPSKRDVHCRKGLDCFSVQSPMTTQSTPGFEN